MTRLQRNHFYVKSYVESHKILFQKISMIIDAYVHSCVLSISKLLIIVHSYIALTAWCSGHRFGGGGGGGCSNKKINSCFQQ
jgi:hypothetical protein